MHSKCRYEENCSKDLILQTIILYLNNSNLSSSRYWEPFFPGMKKQPNLQWTSVDHYPTMYLENEEEERRWYIFAFTRFRAVSCGIQDGGLQVHLGAVQEEAERCDALPAPHQVLAVSPAHKGDFDFLSTFNTFAMRIRCPAVLSAQSVSTEWVSMMSNRTVHWASESTCP